MTKVIPFLDLRPMHTQIRAQMVTAFGEVYDSGVFISGRRLEDFEREYADFSGTKYAVGVSNGLDALYLCLKVLGIGKGDEVIVPSNTYIATVLAIIHAGAKPVFVEPESRTYNIDCSKIAEAVTANTKVIIPVHLYGQACDMHSLKTLADAHGLFIIEDNAQAHGATFRDKQTGSWGHVNATSFYPSKNLGALGDGGAVTTNDISLQKKIKILRNYGSGEKYKNEVIGHNMRLDELQAAFLSIKLSHLGQWTKERQRIAAVYTESLRGVEDLTLPQTHPQATHVFHQYVVRTEQRDALQQHLSDQGIGTLIHYPIPPHLQEACRYLGWKKGDFPIAEELSNTCLTLPIWPGITNTALEKITQSIHTFHSRNTKP